MDRTHALAAFAALSQETRLDALRLLIERGADGALAGEIGVALGVRQNTMSTHLCVLARAGLVRSSREGRAVRYRADVAGVRGLLAFLLDDCCGGRPELCRPAPERVPSHPNGAA